jgi:hypothetical protein
MQVSAQFALEDLISRSNQCGGYAQITVAGPYTMYDALLLVRLDRARRAVCTLAIALCGAVPSSTRSHNHAGASKPAAAVGQHACCACSRGVFSLVSAKPLLLHCLSQRRRRWGAASSGCSLPISLVSLSTLCLTDARASDVAFSRSAAPLE